jgi:hypothetical protein
MSKTPPSVFRAHMNEHGELPRDALLGHIVMYSVSDGEYDRDHCANEFSRLMLDAAYLPHAGRAIDAFRKATTKMDDFEYTLPNGDTAHVLVRDVANDKAQVVRHMIREVKDTHNRRLAYDQIGECKFWRPTTAGGTTVAGSERVNFNLLDSALVPNERPLAEAMAHKMAALYERYARSMDDMKVRAMFRDYVSALNAVQLRSGVYFVHVSRFDDLANLQQLAVSMSAQAGVTCRMDLIPMVDLVAQRELVIEAFQEEATKALDGISAKIANLRASRKKITPAAYANVKEDYEATVKRAVEYTRTLNLTQDKTAGAAEIAMNSLVALQQQMLKDNT